MPKTSTRQQQNSYFSDRAAEQALITKEMTARMGQAFRRGRKAAKKIDLANPTQVYSLLYSKKFGGKCGWRRVENLMWNAGIYREIGETKNAMTLYQSARWILGRAIALGNVQ